MASPVASQKPPLLYGESPQDVTVVEMPAGELHPYHKHEKLVQSLAGVDLASGEEIGVLLDIALCLIVCLPLHKVAAQGGHTHINLGLFFMAPLLAAPSLPTQPVYRYVARRTTQH